MQEVAFLILFSLFHSFQPSEGIFRSVCRRDSLMKVTERDKQLVRTPQDIISEQYADSLPICVRSCTKEEHCRSINYKAKSLPNEKNCQLLAITKSNASSVATNALGWIHYEHVSQVLCSVLFHTRVDNIFYKNKITPSQIFHIKPPELNGYIHIYIQFCASFHFISLQTLYPRVDSG